MKKNVLLLMAIMFVLSCTKQTGPLLEGKKKKRNPADTCTGCQPICLNPPYCDSIAGGN